jgi:hypothetical protein
MVVSNLTEKRTMTTLLYLCVVSMLAMLPLGFGLYYGSRLKAAIDHWRRERALKLLESELDVLIHQRDVAWLQLKDARREALARAPIPPERLKALIGLAHPDRGRRSGAASTSSWLGSEMTAFRVDRYRRRSNSM